MTPEALEDVEAEPIRASRAVRNTALKSYLWERVPRQLLEDATAKARAMEPPLSLKSLLVKLLREWTYSKGEA